MDPTLVPLARETKAHSLSATIRSRYRQSVPASHIRQSRVCCRVSVSSVDGTHALRRLGTWLTALTHVREARQRADRLPESDTAAFFLPNTGLHVPSGVAVTILSSHVARCRSLWASDDTLSVSRYRYLIAVVSPCVKDIKRSSHDNGAMTVQYQLMVHTSQTLLLNIGRG